MKRILLISILAFTFTAPVFAQDAAPVEQPAEAPESAPEAPAPEADATTGDLISKGKEAITAARSGKWLALAGLLMFLVVAILQKFGKSWEFIQKGYGAMGLAALVALSGTAGHAWIAGTWDWALLGEAITIFLASDAIRRRFKKLQPAKPEAIT